jgi:hypothetical protein
MHPLRAAHGSIRQEKVDSLKSNICSEVAQLSLENWRNISAIAGLLERHDSIFTTWTGSILFLKH